MAARVAAALGEDDTWLRLVLGPAGEWHAPANAPEGSTGPPGSQHRRPGSLHRPALRAAPSSAFLQLQSAFRRALVPSIACEVVPSDLTLGSERSRSDGRPLDDRAIHMAVSSMMLSND